MSKTISEWAHQLYETSASKGWHDKPLCGVRGEYLTEVGDLGLRVRAVKEPEVVDIDRVLSKLALVHSEVSEALEAACDGKYSLRFEVQRGNPKPEGMVVELADAVIRILDVCEAMGLPIEAAIDAKSAYNTGREYKHGGRLA